MRIVKLTNKLSLRLLGAIAVSLIVSTLVIIPVSRIIGYFLDKKDITNLSVSVYY
ncbi:hypothetical protein G6549_25325, partial [Bacillus sp. MM2020_1]|nr:hypothetical protein [Bacillus sp. MM2020_1]